MMKKADTFLENYDLGDIKLITIKGNLPCPPLYSIRKTKDYES